MDSYPGGQADWATILQMLKAEDEMLVYQGAMELRDALSYAQENQMQGFSTDQYIDTLVKIVNRDPLTDLSNEVKFFAVGCLTTLMDIFPSLVNGLVHAGLLKGMVSLMQNSMGFVDLAEACIKAFEKIAAENPPAVLRCGAVAGVLQQMDFFELGTQQRVFRIIQKTARHSTSEADFDTHILPVVPFICMSLSPDTAGHDPQKVEDGARIVCEIQDSFCLFYSPTLDFAKIAAQFDKLLACGVYDVVLEHLRQYAETQAKLLGQAAGEPGEATGIDSTGANQVLSPQAVVGFFRILESASRFSHKVASKLFGEGSLLRDLSAFLPLETRQSQAAAVEDYPHAGDAISLLHALISEKEGEPVEEEKQSDAEKARRSYEQAKREYQLAAEQRPRLAEVAQRLLPRVLTVHEASVSPHFRTRTLQVIDKLISLLDHELLRGFVEPQQFANFVLQILRTRHSASIEAALEIAQRVLDCSPMAYAVPFIREGVSQLVKDLSDQQQFKAYMGIPQTTDISDKGFDLDIHEAKEALHHVRAANPDDHAARDFFERRLLELVERQKHPGGAMAAGKAGKAAVKGSANKAEPSRPNVALRIISCAQGLLANYFDNKAFLEQLGSHSAQTQQQLGLLDELTQLAVELGEEACHVQHSMADLAATSRLLVRVAGLLTLESSAITSHEYKRSGLLNALVLLLAKSPSQARVARERQRQRDTGEEMKRAEEIEMLEAQKQSKQLSKKESRCVVLRLKLFTHVLLTCGRPGGGSALLALVELNQKVVSENDRALVGGPAEGARGHQGQPSSAFGREPGLTGHFGAPSSLGDYEHCMGALRQLQKRITVCLIYDPKKEHQHGGRAKVVKAKASEQLLEQKEDPLDEPLDLPELDSQMEDQSEGGSIPDMAEAMLQPTVLKKKGLSHHPALMQLAASPVKGGGPSAIESQKVASSRVYLKRHSLYAELTQIPVTVEQSTCLQLLEDFLRNKVKTADQVRGLKLDYGLGAFGGGGPFGGPPGAGGALFGGALPGQYQSVSQKILRKSLGDAAKKLLDSANERLAKILSASHAVRLKTVDKDQKLEELAEGSGDEMEGVEAAHKSGSEDEDSHSEGYGDLDEDEEAHEQAEIEKQRLLDVFVEELPDEILGSGIPEDQQQVLAKVLTRQHAFMVDQLKASLGEAVDGEDWGGSEADHHEELERLEERLEDFQETMERVHARYLDKSTEKKNSNQEEAKKGSGEKPSEGNQKIEPGFGDGDEEMEDQSEVNIIPSEEKTSLLPDFGGQEEKNAAMKRLSDQGEQPKAGELSDLALIGVEKQIDELSERKKSLEALIEKEFAGKALEREKMLVEKLKGIRQALEEKGAVEPNEVSAQTQEHLTQDLEELIRQQGEDIDFEFFYEGKRILPNQSMFEIIKESASRARQADRLTRGAEQVRVLQAKEEELRKRARRLAVTKGVAGSEEEVAQLKRERERLRELLGQLYSELGGSLRPQGLLGSLNAHKIHFCIRDKCDELADLKRQRLDSLAELTNAALGKRARTKSEAVRDISSGAISEFVQQLLAKEFQVFDDEEGEDGSELQGAEGSKPRPSEVDEDMTDEHAEDLGVAKPKAATSGLPAPDGASQGAGLQQLGQSLKILKVLNYLFCHQDLISDKGLRLVLKASPLAEDVLSVSGGHAGSPEKNQGTVGPDLSDLELRAGFASLSAATFHHHKLDSYLQRSIKDPYNLVQGAISPRMQQIFQNCPFLFPFSTKQLYFRLVSFLSSIDVHRSIYFLRRYLKQQHGGGASKVPGHEKDNLRKIAKQKVLIQRDKLIPSAFALIQKIDKRSFLEFEFQGEEGVGLGPTLEFYDNIADEFRAWSVPAGEGRRHQMWRECADNLLYPAPVSLESLPSETIKQIYEVFRLCGTLVAKAVVDDRQIDLPISPLFWRLCLGEQLSIFDVQKLDATVFGTLAEFSIVAAKAAEVEKQCEAKQLSDEVRKRRLESLTLADGAGGRVEDYALVFTLPCYDDVELIQGGRDRGVELDNAQDYVDLVLHYTFHETVKLQVQAFKKGFDAIFPISSLAPFAHPSSEEAELETMVCGIRCGDAEWRNREELMTHVQPDHGYTRTSEQYLHLMRYITELEPAERPLFLKFLTGSKRLPLGGFKTLSPPLTLVLKREHPGQRPDDILPSVMACQNYVKSPRYSSYEVFKGRFDYAVREGQQNFTLS